MKEGFVYTRWLLTLTFCCLIGLLAVGMMTVHSKRTLRTLGGTIDRKEAQLQELGRRQDILNTDLASSLNPDYLKELVSMSGLKLGPPREDRIIVVHSYSNEPELPKEATRSDSVPQYQTRFELANNRLRKIE
jgi:hypothetical protein